MSQALIPVYMALLLAGCQQRPSNARTADEAVQIANTHRAENFPRAGPARVEVRDHGDRWMITYTLFDAGTGGLSFYEIDKASGNILDHGGYQ